MIQPIIASQVGQILIKAYGLEPTEGFAAARKLLGIMEAAGLQVIRGEWVIPEVITVHAPQPSGDRWMDLAARVTQDTMDREPWKAVELG